MGRRLLPRGSLDLEEMTIHVCTLDSAVGGEPVCDLYYVDEEEAIVRMLAYAALFHDYEAER